MAGNVLKQYEIIINATTKQAVGEINKLKNELKNISKNGDLSSDLKSQLDILTQRLDGFKGEMTSSFKEIKNEIQSLDFSKVKNEFSSNIDAILVKTDELTNAIQLLTKGDFSNIEKSLGTTLGNLSSKMDEISGKFLEFSKFTEDLRVGAINLDEKKLQNEVNGIKNTLKNSLESLRDLFNSSKYQGLFNLSEKELISNGDYKSIKRQFDRLSKTVMDSYNELITTGKASNTELKNIFTNVFNDYNKNNTDYKITDIDSLKFNIIEDFNDLVKTYNDASEAYVSETRKKVPKQIDSSIRFKIDLDKDATGVATVDSIVNKVNEVIDEAQNKIKPLLIKTGFDIDHVEDLDAKDLEKIEKQRTGEERILKAVKVKTKVLASDLQKSVNSAIDEVNKSLNKKIEVGIVGKFDNDALIERTNDFEDEVKYAASNGAFVQIDSNSGVATESTLSSIKSILESWSSSGMPVGQSKEQTQQEQIVNKMERSFNDFFKAKNENVTLTNSMLNHAKDTILNNKLIRTQLEAQSILKSFNRSKKLKGGDVSVVKDSNYYTDFEEINGIKYSKFGTALRGNPIKLEDWQKELDNALESGIEKYLKTQLEAVKNRIKATQNRNNGVEYTKSGKIINENESINSIEDIYTVTQNRINNVKSQNEELYNTQKAQTNELKNTKSIMEQIVALDDKRIANGNLDSSNTEILESLKQQLAERTKIVSNEEEYNKLKQEQLVLEHKFSQGRYEKGDSEKYSENIQKLNALYVNASDDMISYARQQLSDAETGISNIDKLIKKSEEKASQIISKTKSEIRELTTGSNTVIRKTDFSENGVGRGQKTDRERKENFLKDVKPPTSQKAYERNNERIKQLQEIVDKLQRQVTTYTQSEINQMANDTRVTDKRVRGYNSKTGELEYYTTSKRRQIRAGDANYSNFTPTEAKLYFTSQRELQLLKSSNLLYEEINNLNEDTLSTSNKKLVTEEKLNGVSKKNRQLLAEIKKHQNSTVGNNNFIGVSDEKLDDYKNQLDVMQSEIDNTTVKTETQITIEAKKRIKEDVKELKKELSTYKDELTDLLAKQKNGEYVKKSKISDLNYKISETQNSISQLTEDKEILPTEGLNKEKQKLQEIQQEKEELIQKIKTENHYNKETEETLRKILNLNGEIRAARSNQERGFYTKEQTDKYVSQLDAKKEKLFKKKGINLTDEDVSLYFSDIIARETEQQYLVESQLEKQKGNLYQKRLEYYKKSIVEENKGIQSSVDYARELIENEQKLRAERAKAKKVRQEQIDAEKKAQEEWNSKSAKQKKSEVTKRKNAELSEQQKIIDEANSKYPALLSERENINNKIQTSSKKSYDEFIGYENQINQIISDRKARIDEINKINENIQINEGYIERLKSGELDSKLQVFKNLTPDEKEVKRQEIIDRTQSKIIDGKARIVELQRINNELLQKENTEIDSINQKQIILDQKYLSTSKGGQTKYRNNYKKLMSDEEVNYNKLFSEYTDSKNKFGDHKETIILGDKLIEARDKYIDATLKYLSYGGDKESISDKFYSLINDTENITNSINIEKAKNNAAINEQERIIGIAETSKIYIENKAKEEYAQIELNEQEKEYINLLRQEYETKRKNSKTSITKGMSDEQKFASYKVDAQLKKLTPDMTEIDKLRIKREEAVKTLDDERQKTEEYKKAVNDLNDAQTIYNQLLEDRKTLDRDSDEYKKVSSEVKAQKELVSTLEDNLKYAGKNTKVYNDLKQNVNQIDDTISSAIDRLRPDIELLNSFRKEAKGLGLNVSPTTGRMYLDESKKDVALGKDIYTGIGKTGNSLSVKEILAANKERYNIVSSIFGVEQNIVEENKKAKETVKETNTNERYLEGLEGKNLDLAKQLQEENSKLNKLKKKGSNATEDEIKNQRLLVEQLQEQNREVGNIVNKSGYVDNKSTVNYFKSNGLSMADGLPENFAISNTTTAASAVDEIRNILKGGVVNVRIVDDKYVPTNQTLKPSPGGNVSKGSVDNKYFSSSKQDLINLASKNDKEAIAELERRNFVLDKTSNTWKKVGDNAKAANDKATKSSNTSTKAIDKNNKVVKDLNNELNKISTTYKNPTSRDEAYKKIFSENPELFDSYAFKQKGDSYIAVSKTGSKYKENASEIDSFTEQVRSTWNKTIDDTLNALQPLKDGEFRKQLNALLSRNLSPEDISKVINAGVKRGLVEKTKQDGSKWLDYSDASKEAFKNRQNETKATEQTTASVEDFVKSLNKTSLTLDEIREAGLKKNQVKSELTKQGYSYKGIAGGISEIKKINQEETTTAKSSAEEVKKAEIKKQEAIKETTKYTKEQLEYAKELGMLNSKGTDIDGRKRSKFEQAWNDKIGVPESNKTNISSKKFIVESQNKIQEELKETQRQAEQTYDSIKGIFVHFGTDFDISKFEKIANRIDGLNKPAKGFWGSFLDSDYGWEQLFENPRKYSTSTYFESNDAKEWFAANVPEKALQSFYKLKDDARVLVLETVEDLKQLPSKGLDSAGKSLVDWEKVAEKYDAISVKISNSTSEFRQAMYGWDADSLVVTNPNALMQVEAPDYKAKEIAIAKQLELYKQLKKEVKMPLPIAIQSEDIELYKSYKAIVKSTENDLKNGTIDANVALEKQQELLKGTKFYNDSWSNKTPIKDVFQGDDKANTNISNALDTTDAQAEAQKQGEKLGEVEGKAIEKGVRKATQVNSPSPLFIDIGNWIGKSLSMGLDEGLEGSLKTTEDWKNHIVSVLKSNEITSIQLDDFFKSGFVDKRSVQGRAIKSILADSLLPDKYEIQNAVNSTIEEINDQLRSANRVLGNKHLSQGKRDEWTAIKNNLIESGKQSGYTLNEKGYFDVQANEISKVNSETVELNQNLSITAEEFELIKSITSQLGENFQNITLANVTKGTGGKKGKDIIYTIKNLYGEIVKLSANTGNISFSNIGNRNVQATKLLNDVLKSNYANRIDNIMPSLFSDTEKSKLENAKTSLNELKGILESINNGTYDFNNIDVLEEKLASFIATQDMFKQRMSVGDSIDLGGISETNVKADGLQKTLENLAITTHGADIKIKDFSKSNMSLTYSVKTADGMLDTYTMSIDETGRAIAQLTKSESVYSSLLNKINNTINSNLAYNVDSVMPSLFSEADSQKLIQAKSDLLELRKALDDINNGNFNANNIKNLEATLERFNSYKKMFSTNMVVGDSIDLGKISEADVKTNGLQNTLLSLAKTTHGTDINIQEFNKSNMALVYSLKTEDDMINTYTLSIDNAGKAVARLTKSEKYISRFQSVLNGVKKKFGEILNYTLASVSIYRITSFFRQGITVVQEYDAAMVELRKVSNDTQEELNAFGKEAYNIARQIGSTGKEIINSAASWEKLGYNIKEASELAKNSALYSNVGDMDIDTATEHMVSTLKAFNIEAKDSIQIVDKFNEIGNNYAITSEGIGSALERSAASLVAAGNDLDQSIALITAGNIISQDPESVGNAIKVK